MPPVINTVKTVLKRPIPAWGLNPWLDVQTCSCETSTNVERGLGADGVTVPMMSLKGKRGILRTCFSVTLLPRLVLVLQLKQR